jgi:hypothetical protein
MVVGAGLAIGFVAGEHQPKDWLNWTTSAVDVDLRLDHRSALPTNLRRGWDRPENWGVWMSGPEAIVDFGFDGPAEGDAVISIEGRKRAADRPSILRVGFNDVELARWQLPQEAPSLRRQFVIPTALLNSNLVGQLSFDYAEDSPAVFGLERLWIRDARRLGDFQGHLDHCSPEQLSGWAAADGVPLSVIPKSGDKPVGGSFTNVYRADLEKRAFPPDAGFVFRPSAPLPPGTTVDLRFSNGKSLPGSPCRI